MSQSPQFADSGWQGRRLLAVNIAFSAAAQVAKNLCLFLANLAIIKFYGPPAHGDFVLVVSVSGLVMVLSDLGLASKAGVRAIARARARRPEELSATISDLVGLQVVLGLALSAGLLLFSGPIARLRGGADLLALRLTVVWVLAFAGYRACIMIAVGFERMADLPVMGPTTDVGKLLAVLVCAGLGLGIIWVFVGWTVAYVVTLALAALRTRRLLRDQGVRLRLQVPGLFRSLRMLGESLPYYLPMLGQFGLPYMLQLIIGAFHPSRQVSVFNVCYSLAMICRLVSVSVSTAIFPRLAWMEASLSDSRRQVSGMLQQVARLLGLAGTGLFAGFWAFGALALSWLYGRGEAALAVLLVLTFAGGADSYAQQLDQVLMARGYARLLAWLEAVKYGLMGLAAYLAAPVVGTEGVAAVVCAGLLAGALVKMALTRRAVGRAGAAPFALSLVAFALLTGAGLLPLGQYLVLPAWLLVALVLGLLRPREIAQWARLLAAPARSRGRTWRS